MDKEHEPHPDFARGQEEKEEHEAHPDFARGQEEKEH
jgi:hypothetical protein